MSTDTAQLTPAARLSAAVDDALMVVSETVAGNDGAETALDELVRHLNGHSQLTWQFARWWDYQTGPINSDTIAEGNRRWHDVMAAFRAAMEM